MESPSLLIYACDLGPKHSGPGPFMWRKTYSKNYVWGQLISWFRQTSADPGASLVQDRRGCLMLPDISSCYARTPQHDVFRRSYSNKDRKKMLLHMVSPYKCQASFSSYWLHLSSNTLSLALWYLKFPRRRLHLWQSVTLLCCS